ncbi:ABC transporter ATP-binding protein [Kribbia dieselivorans]|uniref:ABC transporter ATP-binding protein n=1 Tax=Kribbia dieselivorans TaxID=331526 RepID=UPI0008384980|nr:ABC transporter ATP-binding protein [Kribbia dieselivorans]
MDGVSGQRGLDVRGANVRFGSKRAVADVDLTLAPGGVLAVLGPSGCGKSTLLRAIAGLEELDSGTIAFDGVDLAGVPTHRRGFAMMFQEGQLFGHTDVAGNVAYGLSRPRSAAAQAEVSRLLELVGLAGYERRRPATLSGGEQQRVALARSLAATPRLLLLDEPLSALDRTMRERLATDLRRLLVETGTTALLVTHDHDEAFTVADRMAVMRAGRVVQEGPTVQVWSHPADVWVARFLGVENVLPRERAQALLRGVDHGDRVLDGMDRLEGTHPRGGIHGANLGVRRSSVKVTPDGPLRGRALSLVMGRDGLRVDVDLPGTGRVAALADPTARVRVGQEVGLWVDPSGLMLLPDVRDFTAA